MTEDIPMSSMQQALKYAASFEVFRSPVDDVTKVFVQAHRPQLRRFPPDLFIAVIIHFGAKSKNSNGWKEAHIDT